MWVLEHHGCASRAGLREAARLGVCNRRASGPLTRVSDGLERTLRIAERAKARELSLAELEHPSGRRGALHAASPAAVVDAADEHDHVPHGERVVHLGASDVPGIGEV